ncbi:MAG: hypothetical protein ACR2HS_06100 [Gammaproteobacteria bacterium]
MFDTQDISNLGKSKKFLEKVLNYNISEEIQFEAALFQLKQSLELLGTLRDKGNTEQNRFFRKTSFLRNALVHGIAILDSPAARAMIATFITIYIPILLTTLNELSSLSACEIQKLCNTMLYKSIASDNYTSTSTPKEHNLAQYQQTFASYIKRLNSIEFKDGDDSFAPIKKAAALNAILSLAEIAKQTKSYPTTFLEICKGAEFILSLSGDDRNKLAHAETHLSIKRIKEIQSKLSPYCTTSASSTNSNSYQETFQQLGTQFSRAQPIEEDSQAGQTTTGNEQPEQQRSTNAAPLSPKLFDSKKC